MTDKICLASKILEMHETAKRIAGKRYPERVQVWKDLLSQIAAKFQVEPLAAVAMAARSVPELTDMDIIWLTAAAVEMIDAASTEVSRGE